MTPIGQLVVIPLRSILLRRLGWVLTGFLAGALLATATAVHVGSPEVVDPRMEKACTWPRHEGEMTVVAVYKNEIVCWKWKS